jgi:hypothetical protein
MTIAADVYGSCLDSATVAVALLADPAAHRHGPTAVLRALGRAERAPDTMAAF